MKGQSAEEAACRLVAYAKEVKLDPERRQQLGRLRLYYQYLRTHVQVQFPAWHTKAREGSNLDRLALYFSKNGPPDTANCSFCVNGRRTSWRDIFSWVDVMSSSDSGRR